jgi:N-acyl-D-amino-acid deacylase
MLKRLKDPVLRAKVIDEMKKSGFDYSKVEIAISPLNKTLAKKTILEIARSQEKSVEEAVVDTLIASEGMVVTSMEVLSEENVEKAVAHPLSIISSNGSGYNLKHADEGELVHQRNFGTFPKFLSKYANNQKILSWEKAIKKITSLPAEKFGLEKRGKIQEKYFADIVVLNHKEIKDLSTKENPYQYSKGIDNVLVNGKIVLKEGMMTEQRGGEILRKE